MIEATITLQVIVVWWKVYKCRNYSMQTKFESQISSWVQPTHENITQQINFMTKLSRMNISRTTVVENTGGRKHWQNQLFRLFGVENFGKWPTNEKLQILNITYIWGRKLWQLPINSPNSPMFFPTNVFHYTVFEAFFI